MQRLPNRRTETKHAGAAPYLPGSWDLPSWTSVIIHEADSSDDGADWIYPSANLVLQSWQQPAALEGLSEHTANVWFPSPMSSFGNTVVMRRGETLHCSACYSLRHSQRSLFLHSPLLFSDDGQFLLFVFSWMKIVPVFHYVSICCEKGAEIHREIRTTISSSSAPGYQTLSALCSCKFTW